MDLQTRIYQWCIACLGAPHAHDPIIRGLRFLEEAVELGQSVGLTRQEAAAIVDMVYRNPPGDRDQEIGGCSITLHALASAVGTDVETAGEQEYARINTPEMMARIRQRNLTKPERSR